MATERSNAPRTIIWLLVVAIVAAAVYFMPRNPTPEGFSPRIALVTADSDPYWDIVILGAEEAAQRSNAQLEIIKGSGSPSEQTTIISRLDGFDAIAVSPVDGDKQGVLLRELARQMPLVTIDSDSSISERLCFVGTDNYIAGRRCGQLIKQALPDGGEVAILAGPLDKENGKARRQGIIDELLDRSLNTVVTEDPLDQPIEGERFTIVTTMVDETTAESAKANATAVLNDHPEIDAIVGIYAYNTPAALAAVTEADKLGQIKLIGFDDNEQTLAGIEAGTVFGTIAQDQFNYGYRAVQLLAEVSATGQTAHVPLDRKMHFPVVLVTRDNIEAFRVSRRGNIMGLRLVNPPEN